MNEGVMPKDQLGLLGTEGVMPKEQLGFLRNERVIHASGAIELYEGMNFFVPHAI
jgi:hypothetical protein